MQPANNPAIIVSSINVTSSKSLEFWDLTVDFNVTLDYLVFVYLSVWEGAAAAW